jgi:ornithine carbamoyltransferase
MKDFLTLSTFKKSELAKIIGNSLELKEMRDEGICIPYLAGKKAALLFEKPSTRTRISFEVGLVELGAYPLVLSKNDLQLTREESIRDTAEIISLYVDLIIFRTFKHSIIEEFAKYAKCPVINALTDKFHPCQALADFMTIYELKKTFKNIKLVYIGDGNNMANSLCVASAILGCDFAIATPYGYEIDADIIDMAMKLSKNTKIEIFHDPLEAVAKADFVYTDVWVSMGNESEAAKRHMDFAGFTVTDKLLEASGKDPYFMHCLPAHIGMEVEESVLYGDHSLVHKQAENRLHIQKAIILDIFEINIEDKLWKKKK